MQSDGVLENIDGQLVFGWRSGDDIRQEDVLRDDADGWAETTIGKVLQRTRYALPALSYPTWLIHAPSLRIISSNLSIADMGSEGQHEPHGARTAVFVIEPNVFDGNVTGYVAEVDELFTRSQRRKRTEWIEERTRQQDINKRVIARRSSRI